MVNLISEYKPKWLLRNGHFNTMYSALTRSKPLVVFDRERITTHDDDFLDLDYIIKDPNRIILLCHGLEGSSQSKYIQGTSSLFTQNGFSVCAMNYRFCSGEINITKKLYHSGFTEDLQTVINHLQKSFSEIHLVGFSLGGNLVLKYSGEKSDKISSHIKSVSAVSVPLNLYTSSLEIMKFQNIIYTKRFLKSLFAKLKLKHDQFPEHFDLSHISKIKNVFDFDEYYTGPLNGFKDAVDYYNKCSSNQFLQYIKIPTLILNAFDDPFLSSDCYPSLDYHNNTMIKSKYTQYGGHVGFYIDGKYCWDELQIFDFISSLK